MTETPQVGQPPVPWDATGHMTSWIAPKSSGSCFLSLEETGATKLRREHTGVLSLIPAARPDPVAQAAPPFIGQSHPSTFYWQSH